MARAKAAGLSDAHVETFPGDGTAWFGTLHGNRGWRVEAGWLDEVRPQPRRIISYDDVRLAVADNSESADVTVELVDVGAGTQRSDYAGKDVRGKLVLCDATPSACHRQAVEELGAAGLVSYNSNQVSAWWRDDQDLIRWGHLDSRGRRNAFAIMISVREARALQQRLARGEHITLHAVVRARNDDSMGYETLVATIPGSDPGGRRHRLQLPPGSREARRQRQRQRLRRQPRDRENAQDLDRHEADPAAGPDDSLHLAVGDDRHDRLPVEIPGDRRADPSRRAPRHGRRRSVHHQVGAARHPLALVDRDGDRRRRGSVRALRHRRRDARGRRRRHDARGPRARRLEGRLLGRHHAVRERQRSLDLSGGRLRHPVDLPARSPRHLHPHHRRPARQHRADQDQAVRVHRGGERLLPRDDAGPRRLAAASDLRERARTDGRGRTAGRGDGGRSDARRRRREYRGAGCAARTAAPPIVRAAGHRWRRAGDRGPNRPARRRSRRWRPAWRRRERRSS